VSNGLEAVNDLKFQDIVALRDVIASRYAAWSAPHSGDYPIARLQQRITQSLAKHAPSSDDLLWEIDFLDRAKFDADFAIRLTSLLKKRGAREYIKSDIPWIVDALRDDALSEIVKEVSHRGIYVNVRLVDRWFLNSVQEILDLGREFGKSDSESDRTYIVDYSSPNVAKALHAGHIRSTIIGHVLGNLYQACGALVYRINHINDFGGFGFILEGFRRFGELFPEKLGPGERLVEIYSIRRALEKAAVEPASGVLDADSRDAQLLRHYFPGAGTPEAIRAAYREYVAASDERFRRLEDGDPEEVALWKLMVEWSLADFESFYAALDIHIDLVIGESFYLAAGDAAVSTAIQSGKAFVLTEERVRTEIAQLDLAVAAGEMTAQVRDANVAALEKDIGAVVVPLPNNERLVVRRSDGRSIYATRDLGAIKLRREIFNPTDINYVVGQEQRVHFSRLFEAADVLGIVTEGKPALTHTYFGFYVDAETGRKLSSRDSVAGVNELLSSAVRHFREKSAENGQMTEDELDNAAQQLAVGAVVFNDLKRDMKGPVPISRANPTAMLTEFEKSGGPYVVYSACRARAILRKYGGSVPRAADIGEFDLSNQEAMLILRLLELPDKALRAAREDNPSILVRHLLDTAGIYNSYYASAPVLHEGNANKPRLMITRAVELMLTNGLSFCHIECPPKI